MEKPSLQSRRSFIKVLSGVALGSSMFTSKYVWDMFESGHASLPVEAQKAVPHAGVGCEVPPEKKVEITPVTTPAEASKVAQIAGRVFGKQEVRTQLGILVDSGGHPIIEDGRRISLSPKEAYKIQYRISQHYGKYCECVHITHETDPETIAKSVNITEMKILQLQHPDITCENIMTIRGFWSPYENSQIHIRKVVHFTPAKTGAPLPTGEQLLSMVMTFLRAPDKGGMLRPMPLWWDRTVWRNEIPISSPFFAQEFAFDTRIGETLGRSGKQLNWDLAAAIIQAIRKTQVPPSSVMVLAGGLTAENVGDAQRTAADIYSVSSSVHSGSGADRHLDLRKVEEFMRALKAANP